MTDRQMLRLVFSLILIGMLAVTSWASLQQPVWEWGGLKGADAAWTRATLADAYAGFLTFYTWVFWRERSLGVRIGWLVAILLLGNIAMSTYMLIALHRLPKDAPFTDLFARSRT